jgi:hypothetical protein
MIVDQAAILLIKKQKKRGSNRACYRRPRFRLTREAFGAEPLVVRQDGQLFTLMLSQGRRGLGRFEEPQCFFDYRVAHCGFVRKRLPSSAGVPGRCAEFIAKKSNEMHADEVFDYLVTKRRQERLKPYTDDTISQVVNAPSIQLADESRTEQSFSEIIAPTPNFPAPTPAAPPASWLGRCGNV